MSQNSDTHSTCNERLAREGEKATCCTCNPHEGCTLGMKPTKTPTQNEWEKRFDEKFTVRTVGVNSSAVKQYFDAVKEFTRQELADARDEVIGKVEKRLIDIRQRCSYLSINSTEIVDPYVANLNAGLDGLASDLATLREEKTK